MTRPAVIYVDLAALHHNCQRIREFSPNSSVLGIVKANAYGHGAIDIAKALAQPGSGVNMLAVAAIDEAIPLRRAGITMPILLLEGCFHPEEYQLASQLNLQVVFHCQQQLDELRSQNLASPITAWLKIDTGMHRLGFLPEDAEQSYQHLLTDPSIAPHIVLMTHIASADSPDNPHTTAQIQYFHQLHQHLQRKFNITIATSIGNSATIMAWPAGQSDIVRPGIMMYGCSPFASSTAQDDKLKPVMTLKSAVIAVREVKQGDLVGYGGRWQARERSIIATVAIGYGDGYPSSVRDGTPVLVNGNLAYIAGRVAMDMLTIDVTQSGVVNIGDEVVLWGASLDVNLVAKHANTIGYELITRMPQRVPKIYVANDNPRFSS